MALRVEMLCKSPCNLPSIFLADKSVPHPGLCLLDTGVQWTWEGGGGIKGMRKPKHAQRNPMLFLVRRAEQESDVNYRQEAQHELVTDRTRVGHK